MPYSAEMKFQHTTDRINQAKTVRVTSPCGDQRWITLLAAKEYLHSLSLAINAAEYNVNAWEDGDTLDKLIAESEFKIGDRVIQKTGSGAVYTVYRFYLFPENRLGMFLSGGSSWLASGFKKYEDDKGYRLGKFDGRTLYKGGKKIATFATTELAQVYLDFVKANDHA